MLELISFVGVDTKTNIEDISKLVDKSQIPLEFGVLYSEKRGGNANRYPTLDQCMNILLALEGYDVMASLHLCGQEAIDKFLSKDKDVLRLMSKSSRIQLNFNISNYHNKEYDEDALIEDLLTISNHHTLIIQDNKSKGEFVKKLKSMDKARQHSNCSDRFNFLYDASGGVGKTINTFQHFDNDYFTGYAGGISPSTIAEIYKGIERANYKKSFVGYPLGYYLDMESGVRTDDWFDVSKCESIVGQLVKLENITGGR